MSYVLLIEPNTVLAATYMQALQHVGHDVAHVTGAQAAIEAADAQKPDIVVLELQLPRHSGLEFLHEFRSYTDWQQTPVLVHTSLPPTHTSAAAEVLQRDLGVRRILYKPQTSLQDLIRAVREQMAAAA